MKNLTINKERKLWIVLLVLSLLILMSGFVYSVSPDNFQVAHYKFENNMNDATIFSNNGTTSGGAYTTSSPKLDSYSWGTNANVDSYFTTPNNANFSFGTNYWVVSMWIRLSAQSDNAWRFQLASGTSDGQAWFTGGNALQACFVDCTNNTLGISAGSWHHIVMQRSSLYAGELWIDGIRTGVVNTSGSRVKLNGTQWRVGYASANKADIEDFRVYNGIYLTDSQIAILYNSGNGNSTTNLFPETIPSYVNNLSFVSQVPINLTASTLFTQNFNLTYNFTNQTVSLSGIKLNYSLTGSQSCLQFQNGSCILLNNTLISLDPSSSLRVDNSTLASWILTENQVYSFTDLRNGSFFNQTHVNFTLSNSNDFIAMKLLNVSNTTQFNIFELDVRSNVLSRLYVCNSSLNLTGVVDPSVVSYCQEFGSINNASYNHQHNVFGGHNLFPFSIINGKVGGSGISATSVMWFVVRGQSSGSVNVGYVDIPTLSTSVYSSANGGNSWINRDYTIDMRLHQWSNNEFLNYYAQGTFNGSLIVSSTVNERIDVPYLNPSAPIITVPFNTVQSTQFLNITYLNGTANSPGTSLSYYNLSLLNSDLSFNRSIVANNSLNNSFYYDLYSQNLSVGTYYVQVKVFDNLGNFASDEEWFNLTRNALLNVSAYDVLTNATLSNLNVTLTDLSVSSSLSLNTSGSLLQFNVIKGHLYNLFFDVPSYIYDQLNYTINQSSFQVVNKSLFKTNSVTIYVMDETSLTMITNATTGLQTNITLISNVSSVTYNTTTGYLFISNITAGVYEVKFNAPLYAQRSYFITVTDRSTQTLNAYLTQSTINLLLTYVNKETGELLEGCGIVVAKVVNGSWTTVASGFTDITGRTQFAVSTNTNYRFSSTCSGYDDKTFNLNPVIFTSYTIQLTKQISSGSQLDFTNINVYVSNTTFTNNGSNYFAWQISAPSGTLQSFGYNLTTQCKSIANYSGVNAYGGTNSNTFNLSCASTTDSVTLTYFYTLVGGQVRSFTYSYSIQGPSNSNTFVKNQTEHYGMGLFERALLVVLITIIMAGLITKFSNIVAGLGTGLLILSYMSYIGFIEWWLIAPTLLVGFILISAWSTTR